jgi:hypothetical protein
MIAAGAAIVPAFGDGELNLQQDILTGGMAQLLRQGQAIFGIFSGPKTPQQGAEIVDNRDTDFVFYSMETGPFDIPQMQAYMAAMNEAAGSSGTHPTALRIPPTRYRWAEGLPGASGVFEELSGDAATHPAGYRSSSPLNSR